MWKLNWTTRATQSNLPPHAHDRGGTPNTPIELQVICTERLSPRLPPLSRLHSVHKVTYDRYYGLFRFPRSFMFPGIGSRESGPKARGTGQGGPKARPALVGHLDCLRTSHESRHIAQPPVSAHLVARDTPLSQSQSLCFSSFPVDVAHKPDEHRNTSGPALYESRPRPHHLTSHLALHETSSPTLDAGLARHDAS